VDAVDVPSQQCVEVGPVAALGSGDEVGIAALDRMRVTTSRAGRVVHASTVSR
jgi:hypothetical protein